MGTTQRMAQFIAGTKFEDIPTPAVNLAKLCLLDAVGCAIYGTTRPLGKIITSLVEDLGGKPVARVVGTNIETNSVNAALANGALGHSEDFDDFAAGHQAVTLFPVVLGLGEELRANGKQALVAYAVGFDVTSAITHSMGEDHYGKGWHSTSSTVHPLPPSRYVVRAAGSAPRTIHSIDLMLFSSIAYCQPRTISAFTSISPVRIPPRHLWGGG